VTQQLVFISATVQCETEEQAVKAMEALSRVATGLALDGQTMQITAAAYDPDEDDDDPDQED
jgi:hypothetical protein